MKSWLANTLHFEIKIDCLTKWLIWSFIETSLKYCGHFNAWTIIVFVVFYVFFNPLSVGLQKWVRGQNGGSWGCQTHLGHFQIAIMCISCVYTCLHLWVRNKSKVCIRHSKHVRTHAYMWNTRGRHLTII